MEQTNEISILPSPRQLRNDLLVKLVQEDSSFRQSWANLVEDKRHKEIILDYQGYPTLSSLLSADLPFSAKKELIRLAVTKLAGESDQRQVTLTSLLRNSNEAEIRRVFELPYWYDLDLVELVFTQIKIGKY